MYPLFLICLLLYFQHRRDLRLSAAAKVREKQLVKELKKVKKTEAKENQDDDVTADVFLTPAEEKPVHIQTEAPKQAKKNRNKPFKRQRMQRARK